MVTLLSDGDATSSVSAKVDMLTLEGSPPAVVEVQSAPEVGCGDPGPVPEPSDCARAPEGVPGRGTQPSTSAREASSPGREEDAAVLVSSRAGTAAATAPRRPRATAGRNVVDLTDDDVEVVSSTVRAVPRKRPAPQHMLTQPYLAGWARGLPLLPPIVRQAPEVPDVPLKPAPAPVKSPSRRGPVCGICLEPMGPSSGRRMASGPCG